MSRRVGIVGAGSIGVAWAVTFARAGWSVRVVDPDPVRVEAVEAEIQERLGRLDAHGLLGEPVDVVAERVEAGAEQAWAVGEAELVIECAPERLELKREVYRAVLESAPGDALLTSSTSALSPTSLFDGLAGAERCLVAHPTNPPYLLPVVELVPAGFTAETAVESAREMFAAVGMSPILVRSEAEGFVVNRLQGAILREAYCLLRDGVASVDEIDLAVRGGLGRRWALTGPFETADLNTRGGIASHAEKMGAAYERMGAERGQDDPWTPELVARAEAGRREILPLDEWGSRVLWRDEQLMKAEAARREVDHG
ncbi:MAG: 3-hydroxyacyl-CoA dehydrogenase [Solirubrobacterales bacterium 67-14]|nr:MAG: 3-hydroxyacyl-CoA dehydrogenase [Solirubrobacterales bacterium 67-14]